MIVGLGNIGQEYEDTRHNIGFKVVESIAETLSVSFGVANGPFLVAETSYKGRKLQLIKPTTYMNLSGTAVKKALQLYQTEMDDCLIVYDDLNLPVGEIRIKPKGSDGGHNGIADINEKLQTRSYPRLRVGIGNNFRRGKQVDYVLSPFDPEEESEIAASVQKAHEAALLFVHQGLERAMNSYN
jgi:PTH1 family peptidyl-tRNA hydrolase